MNKFFAYLLGAGWGAGLMYFLDPDQGQRRQDRVQRRFQQAREEFDTVVDAGVRDLRNRARGSLFEVASLLNNEQADDWVLAERARARLGTLTRHHGAIQVSVQNGHMTLTGDVLEHEAEKVLKGLASVRGLGGIENNLKLHSEAGDIQALRNTGDSAAASNQWLPSTRLLAGAGSLYLLLRGRRGGFFGRLYTLGGLFLGIRTVTNLGIKQFFGMTGNDGAIQASKGIRIHAPVSDVYALWSNFEMFSMFMSHVKQIDSNTDGTSHWVVDGPAGVPVEFDTIVTQEEPERIIAWETVPGSSVAHSGQVRFHETEDGGTHAHVQMRYTPPAGAIGHAVASFFGKDPARAMADDLARLKALLEDNLSETDDETAMVEDLNSL